MIRTITLTAPDDEVLDGLRSVGEPDSGELPDLRRLDDEVFSVAGFEQDSDELLGAVLTSVAGLVGAAASGPRFGGSIASGFPNCRSLDAASTALVARLGDTQLRRLYEQAWSGLSGRADATVHPEPDPDWTQSLRSLVIQARSAVANGWKVYVWSSVIETSRDAS